MARVRLNPVIQGLHGRVGGLVFRDSGHGETVVYKAPEKAERSAKTGPGSRPHPFREAHAYAQCAMTDPEMMAYYEQVAKTKQMDPYHAALSGYFEVQRKLGE